jgi:hypothetical protein
MTLPSPALTDRSLGFHPKRPNHRRKRKSTMMPPRRETTSIDAAIIGTDSRVGHGFHPDKLHSERGLADACRTSPTLTTKAQSTRPKQHLLLRRPLPHTAQASSSPATGPPPEKQNNDKIWARISRSAATTHLQPPESNVGEDHQCPGPPPRLSRADEHHPKRPPWPGRRSRTGLHGHAQI